MLLLVDGLLVLPELAGGSLDMELVELDDGFDELFPQPTRNITARIGIIVTIIFIIALWFWFLLKDGSIL